MIPIDPADDCTWKPGGGIPGFNRFELGAVNLVFYRRDGGGQRLLLERPAWLHAVYLPEEPGHGDYYYELGLADTSGDDRLDHQDAMTLWASAPDGSDLRRVWLPAGQVASTGFREPLSGDLFTSLLRDTDGDGRLSPFDQPQLVRLALGDTTAVTVVSDALVERINDIVFGSATATKQF